MFKGLFITVLIVELKFFDESCENVFTFKFKYFVHNNFNKYYMHLKVYVIFQLFLS